MIDSPPSSAESSFRELDEVFLQTQTRIWLGEVINSRLDENLHLSDLLQDGEILFEVSKVVWKLLLSKCMEFRHLKHKYGPFGSRTSSGRYRPYSNIDSFIKICKILGLSDIDLFSPSDVVEKKDIRKVCICIRALSKKARSKQLSAPDFDMVIYSVFMPRNVVGVIRKGLESSQSTLSSSSSYSSCKVSQMKLQKNNLRTPCNDDNGYCSSGESDEAESRYMGDNAFSGKFNYVGGVNSDLENSLEGRCIEEINNEHCKSASLSEMSSCGIVSRKQIFNNGITHVNNDARLENDYSVVGDSSCNEVGDSNYISSYLAFSDLMVHATDCSNFAICDGENSMFDFFLNVDDSQGPASNRSFRNGSLRKFSDEDTEVSSTTSMSSVLGRLLNLEFDEHFDEDEPLSAHDPSSVSKELCEAEKYCKDSFVVSEPPKLDMYETDYQIALFETREAQSETETEDEYELLSGMEPLEGLCGVRTRKNENHVFCSEKNDMIAVDDNMPPIVSDDTTFHISVQPNLCETILDNHPCLPVKDMNGTDEDTAVAYNVQDNISYSAGENERSLSQDNKDASLRPPPVKHGQRPLLRTVVKGTAIAGVLFLLLYISGKGKGNDAQSNQHGQILKYSDSKSSSTKKRQKKIVGKGIYPSEKIKL